MVYFLADFHLGAAYIKDKAAHEMKVVNFLREITPKATRVYLMGDILDFWWEYKKVVPKGFVRFFGQLAQMADQGIEITWLKGNHDIWIDDYLPREIGFKLHDGPLEIELSGKRFFLEHGDGVGELPRSFRLLRKLFRNKVCQKGFSFIHPRWGMALAHAWSAHSRKSGGYVPTLHGEENSLVRFAEDYSLDHDIDYFIFGHQHILLDRLLPTGPRIIILGDWISHPSYAVFDGHRLELHKIIN